MTHDLSNRTMYVRTVLWTDAATQVVVQPANKNPSTAAGTVPYVMDLYKIQVKVPTKMSELF